jgi:hypothetical protein
MSETGTYRTTEADVPDEILEKRRFPRTREYGSQQIEIQFLGEEGRPESSTATLWDFGEGGLGMECPRPFAPGEEVQITGALHGPDYSMQLKAKAIVAYSRQVDAECFRIGVAFSEVTYRRLPPTAESEPRT